MALFMNIRDKSHYQNSQNNQDFHNGSGQRIIQNGYKQNVQMNKISLDDLLKFIALNVSIHINHTQNHPEEDIDIDALKITNPSEENVENMEIVTDIVSLQQNLLRQLKDLPYNLNNSLSKFYNDLTRIGVLKYNDTGINISLYTSILTCIKDDFKIQHTSIQQNYVKQLNSNLVTFVNSKFVDYKYKDYKWIKNDVISQVKSYSGTKAIMRIFHDYLCVNIFLIDISNDKLFVIDTYSPFKKSIILLLIGTNEQQFEPVSYKGSYCFVGDGLELINSLTSPDASALDYLVPHFNSGTDGSEIDLDKYIPSVPKLSLQEKNILNMIKKSTTVKLTDDLVEKNSEITSNEFLVRSEDLLPSDGNDINKIDEEIDENIVLDQEYDNISEISESESKLIPMKYYLEKIYKSTTKLEEIQQDAKNLNISLDADTNTSKKKTKAQLISEIKAKAAESEKIPKKNKN